MTFFLIGVSVPEDILNTATQINQYDIMILLKSSLERFGYTMEFLVQYQAYIAIALVWSAVWKGLALWRAARLKQVGWYIALMIINMVGLFEFIYLIATHKKVSK